MTSLSNLTSAKVRRFFLIAALVVCPFLAIQSGNAQTVSAQLVNPNNGSSTLNIMQGEAFTLRLQITTNFLSSGITFFLQSNNGSGFFRITSRDITLSPYPDRTTSDAQAFGGDAGLLNPTNDFDLGLTNNGSDTSPAGSYTISLLNFANTAPIGTYTISVFQGVVTDRTNNGFNDVPFTAMATVNVVPEPTTVGMAVIGGGMLLVAGYRKHRRSKVA